MFLLKALRMMKARAMKPGMAAKAPKPQASSSPNRRPMKEKVAAMPSESASNAALLRKALRDVRSGDILLAHLGIWSRKDPWAPTVLEPLIVGLKQQGFCFRTLREHPQYGVAR